MVASRLTGIKLFNYRNFKKKDLVFCKSHTLLTGKNAVGKTNILEAISFLSPGNGFKKDNVSNIIQSKSLEKGAGLEISFNENNFKQKLNINFNYLDSSWSKLYLLNDKKISQNHLMSLFQIFWFSELDKVFFIKDKQYHRNACNRIICYFDFSLIKALSHFKKLRREKRDIFNKTRDTVWAKSIDIQLLALAKTIIEIKYQFMIDFNNFILKSENFFFKYDLKFELSEYTVHDFIRNFELEIHKETNSLGAYSINSVFDPLKSVFTISHQGTSLDQLSSAQSKLLILSFFLDVATFLKQKKNLITIFLIDEIFDNFDIINLQKVIKYCADNKFQSFFSATDNFTIKDEIKNLDIVNII